MIRCEDVSFSYEPRSDAGEEGSDDALKEVSGDGRDLHDADALKQVSCTIEEGSFVLLCGVSGCGKTTLTHLMNGLIPHFFDGCLSGRTTLFGADVEACSLFDISRKVGSVFQNPRSQFFSTNTTSEIAFGPENHGLPQDEIEKRVMRVSKQLGVGNLLGRSIFALSGGEKQKIACASAAALEPDAYVFDEPSSNLDGDAIAGVRDMLAALREQGKTVVIAEHRLHYLMDLIDRVIFVQNGRIAGDYTAAEFRALPCERRERMGLRPLSLEELDAVKRSRPAAPRGGGDWVLRDFRFSYRTASREALCIDEAELACAQATAIIGRNGAGKTTFLRSLGGLERRCKGVVEREGERYGRKRRLKCCYMVMQDVNHQLFTESVIEELLISMPVEDVSKAEDVLRQMDLLAYRDRHPMGLSGGQKQRVAIASAIASERPLIAFDEPTSGLDLFHMRRTADAVNRLVESGRTVAVVTHDPEFILRCCDRVLHIEGGRVVGDYALDDSEGRSRLLRFFSEMYAGRESSIVTRHVT